MNYKYYAIKNNMIVCGFNVAPDTKRNRDKLINKEGFDTYIKKTKKGVLAICEMMR